MSVKRTQLSDKQITNLIHEVIPQKKFTDLILTCDVLDMCNNLIKEQFDSSRLRSYNTEPRNRVLLVVSPYNGKAFLAEALIIPFSYRDFYDLII